MTIPSGWRLRPLPGSQPVLLSDGRTLGAAVSVVECDRFPGLTFTTFHWTCPCGTVVDTASTPDTHRDDVTGGCIHRCTGCGMCYSVLTKLGGGWRILGSDNRSQ